MDGEGQPEKAWRKAIPQARDRIQSRVLVWVMGSLLIAGTIMAYKPWTAGALVPLLGSMAFALIVWLLRSATLAAAFLGFLICAILGRAPVVWTGFSAVPVFHPALTPLVILFVLTFAATKFGQQKKKARGLEEPKGGRRASQIVANLSVAALCALLGMYDACIAALAEATADTVSSEVGQAIGGRTWLLTTIKPVATGEDGGVSVAGTIAGMISAGVVVAAGSFHHVLWPYKTWVIFAAVAGLFFDSLLGATLEQKGYFGNDLVNFASTLFAAVLAAIPYLFRK